MNWLKWGTGGLFFHQPVLREALQVGRAFLSSNTWLPSIVPRLPSSYHFADNRKWKGLWGWIHIYLRGVLLRIGTWHSYSHPIGQN